MYICILSDLKIKYISYISHIDFEFLYCFNNKYFRLKYINLNFGTNF